MMLLTSTCGYRSLPSRVKKPRCWKPCNTTWQHIPMWDVVVLVNLAFLGVFTLPFWKILLLEIDTYCVGQHAWESLGPGKRDDGVKTGVRDLDSEEERVFGKILQWMMPFISSWEKGVSISSSPSPSPLRSRSRVKQNLAVFQKGHDQEKFELVIKRVAYEDRLATPLDDDGGQSSQERWKKPAPGRSGKKLHTLWKNWRRTKIAPRLKLPINCEKRNRSPAHDRWSGFDGKNHCTHQSQNHAGAETTPQKQRGRRGSKRTPGRSTGQKTTIGGWGMERQGRLSFRLGAGTEEIRDPERKNLANGTEQYRARTWNCMGLCLQRPSGNPWRAQRRCKKVLHRWRPQCRAGMICTDENDIEELNEMYGSLVVAKVWPRSWRLHKKHVVHHHEGV